MTDFCTCTHPDAGQCGSGPVCPCACHRSMAAAWQTPQGPRQPLDELAQLRQENERLQKRIAALEAASRLYLTNSTPVNAVKLDKILKEER